MSGKNRACKLRVVIYALSLVAVPLVAAEPGLAGLWESQRLFDPQHAGSLLIRESGDRLFAEISGRRVEAEFSNGKIAFAISNDTRFQGDITDDGNIRGHWLQPPSELDGNVFATPVRLQRRADGWHGEVIPQPNTATFYLLLRENGSELTADLINPERNLGVFAGLTRAVLDGNEISLLGRFRDRGQEREMLRGVYIPDEDVLSIRYPGRGGGYDFQRVNPGVANDFSARNSTSHLIASPPPSLDDGWETASPGDVGIDVSLVENLIVNHVLPARATTHDLSIHALLIARHGKLVVEEYFYGYHRDLPHDSRSASKGVTAILAAAAMQSGARLEWDTPVYPLFDTAELLQRHPERGRITLRHLVNMNTGLDCDDRNPDSAANEDYLWDNAGELDFYEHTLNVDVVHAPGEVAAYCSASANLAGGVIEAAAGENLLSLIDRLLAEPLGIARYSVSVPPDGHPYMGGGIRWLARDFLKFPQLLLDGGERRGRRVLSEDDVRRILTPAVTIDGGRDYGYLWWAEDYPYQDRTVRAHFMAGNGGQIAMLVPDLDLSIVFNAGNYSDRVFYRIQEELVPEYILPAIRK